MDGGFDSEHQQVRTEASLSRVVAVRAAGVWCPGRCACEWGDREFTFFLPERSGESVEPNDLAHGTLDWPDAPAVFVVASKNPDGLRSLRDHYPRGRLVEPAAAFSAFVVDPSAIEPQ